MKRKIYELSFVINEVMYYEASDGELLAYKGGPIHKLNFFEVDKHLNLIKSLYRKIEVERVYQNKHRKIVVIRRDKYEK